MAERRVPSPRKSVSLLLKLSYGGVDEFVESYATNISKGGIFIRSREPVAIGTSIQFKVELAGGRRVLQGRGVVKWHRGAGNPAGPPGMGLEFEELDPESRLLVDTMLASKPKDLVTGPFAPSPTEGAPSPPSIRPVAAPVAPVQSAEAPSTADPFELAVDLDLDSLVGEALPPQEPPATAAPGAAGFDFASALSPAPAPRPLRAQASSLPSMPAVTSRSPSSPPAVSPVVPATRGSAASPPEVAPAATRVPPLTAPSGTPAAPAGSSAPPTLPPAVRGQAPAIPSVQRGPAGPPPVVPGRPLGPPVMTQQAPVLAQAPPALAQGLAPGAAAPRAPGALRFLKPPVVLEASGVVIGIDLGTSNSCCAVLVNQRPQILHSKDGYSTIPSVVALGKQGNLLVGQRARSQQLLNPKNSVYGAKRLVGRDFDSETVAQVRERFHYPIVAGPDGKAAVHFGDALMTLEEVQGLILRECKDVAEQHTGGPVSRAVITCPAYYSEQQREAVRKAAAMAGLKVERVLNEPTAAALAYGLNRGLTRRVLVYDLGGGTFDATLMRIDDNVFEVLATGGDIFLGGLDFDSQVVDVLLERFQKQHGVAFDGDPIALSRVTDEAERAKIALSERTSVDVHLPMLLMTPQGTPLDLKCTLTRDELNAACADLVDRTLDVVQDVLLDAKLKASELEDIVLVGGQSRMPLVRERIKAKLGKAPLASVNADEAVALGAALFAGTIDKVSNVVLIDVVPMTMGIGLPGGGFKRVIERNTPLPALKSFALETTKADETFLELNIFQGEDGELAGNEYVGTTRIEGLPPGPKGSVKVAVTLRLDAECVLHIEARELSTRRAFSATLATRYSSEEIRQKLGVSAPKREAVATARGKELEQRGGKFWAKLKKLVGVK